MSGVANLWQASSIWIAWGFQLCRMCTGRHRSHNVRPTPVQPDPKGKFLGNERRPGADQKLFSTSRFFSALAENIWRIRGHTCMHALLIYIYITIFTLNMDYVLVTSCYYTFAFKRCSDDLGWLFVSLHCQGFHLIRGGEWCPLERWGTQRKASSLNG